MMTFALLIDDQVVGSVQYVSGGISQGNVIPTQIDNSCFVAKGLKGYKNLPLIINIGLGSELSIFDWISESWSGRLPRRKCTLLAIDEQGCEFYKWHLLNSYISEMKMPACDSRSNKEYRSFTLTIVPSKIDYEEGNGSQIQLGYPQKDNFISDFHVEIGNLPCNQVIRIDPFSWKQIVGKSATLLRRPIVPTTIDAPNLILRLPFQDIGPWEEWFRKSVIKGESIEENGSIELLKPNLDVLVKIRLEKLRPISFGIEPSDVNAERDSIALVELSCEEMYFEGY